LGNYESHSLLLHICSQIIKLYSGNNIVNLKNLGLLYTYSLTYNTTGWHC